MGSFVSILQPQLVDALAPSRLTLAQMVTLCPMPYDLCGFPHPAPSLPSSPYDPLEPQPALHIPHYLRIRGSESFASPASRLMCPCRTGPAISNAYGW